MTLRQASSLRRHAYGAVRMASSVKRLAYGVLLLTAGIAMATECLYVVPAERQGDLPRSAIVTDRTHHNDLVIADSNDLEEIRSLGGCFLDVDPRDNLYYRVQPPDSAARARLAAAAQILLIDSSDYVVRVSTRQRDKFNSLSAERQMISTYPHGRMTVIGAGIGVVFASLVVIVLWWLIAVPPQVAAVAAHARRVVSSIRRIVVPTNMHTNWERAVELACRLGEDQKAEILLTYIVEVPFTLSLGAPMGKAEKAAKELLERAVEIVEHHGLPVRTQIERARLAGEGIARLARDEEADLIVMAMPKSHRGIPTRTVEILLHRAPCEVIIDSAPGKAEEPELDTLQPSDTGTPPA